MCLVLNFLLLFRKKQFINAFYKNVSINIEIRNIDILQTVNKEYHARVELLIEQMKAGAGIMEELKAAGQMNWIELMNNVKSAAEEIVLRELVYA